MRVLIAEDYSDLRTLIEFVLNSEFGASTISVENGQAAIKELQQNPSFDLIISDMKMPNGDGREVFEYYRKAKLKCPFLFLSSEPAEAYADLHAAALHWMPKPFLTKDLTTKVSQLIKSEPLAPESYSPVHLSLLKRVKKIEVPLYVKINDHKFVRLTSSPVDFTDEEEKKYAERGLDCLYINALTAETFISQFRKEVLSLEAWNQTGPADHELISLNTELLKSMSQQFGWTPATIQLTKDCINKALHLVKANPEMHAVFNQFHKIERFGFPDHCTASLMFSLQLLKSMGFEDEMTVAKITFCAILHDLTLTDEQYAHKTKIISHMNKKDKKTADEKAIFEHPIKAAELCRTWDFCPPFIDQIILNHHERPDGSGFPYGRKYSELDLLTCAFIMSEDLVENLIASYGKPNWQEYLRSRKNVFNKGHFKALFRNYESMIRIQEAC